MSQCWCLEYFVLLLPIGHFRRVTWLPKFLWLLVVSASSQQAFHHDWALFGNLEAGLQWKLWWIHETTGKYHYKIWKLAMHFVIWLGLHFTMNFSTILSFICDPRVYSNEVNKVCVSTFTFLLPVIIISFWNTRLTDASF